MKRSLPTKSTNQPQNKLTKIDFKDVEERLKKQRYQEIAKNFKYEASSIILNIGLLISNFESDLNLALRYRSFVKNYKENSKDCRDLAKSDFERLKKFYQLRCQREKLTANCKSTINSENPWEFKLENLGGFACVIVSSGIILSSGFLNVISEDGHTISFSNSDQDPDTVSFGFTVQSGVSSKAEILQKENGYSLSYTLTTKLEKQTIHSCHIFTNKEAATKIADIYCSEFQKMLSFVPTQHYHFTCCY